MNAASDSLTVLTLLPWAVLWLFGGFWLARAAFRLGLGEELLVGIAAGWVVQNWLSNLLAQVLPVLVAFWVSAAVVFLGGGLAVWLRLGWKALVPWSRPGEKVWPVWVPQVIVLALLVYLSFSIGRGMAIFDDFQHLPTASLMAAGDFPPHFVLDPKVVFGYHHFLLLFSAQLIRVGLLPPWLAVDAARAISFGLAVVLAALFSLRVTRSLLGGLLGGVVVAFASGTRWLLLLLPPALVAWLGKSVQLIGSGAGSGANLPEALQNAWAVEGAGPLAFPFAFANGIYPAGMIQAHNANGLTGFILIFLLLLTFDRWRGGLGAVLSAVLISVWGLIGEAELPAIAAGWGIVAVASLLASRARPWHSRLPRALWAWLGVAAAGVLIGLLQGGAWTDILMKSAARLSGSALDTASYQTIGFQFAWPPAVVSSHLGVLSVFDPRSLLVALFEMGPLLLVFPLLAVWGVKAFRLGRWYEAATAAAAVGMLLSFFVQFSGSTGVRNTPRLYVFMPLLAALAVPLAWQWASHRSAVTKIVVAFLGLVTITGGLVMSGVEFIAIQRPVYSYFLTPLDARMTSAYWDRLEAGALVFDPTPYRAPTVLGRSTNSSFTWYQTKPEWDALRSTPDPFQLRAAGYSYLYLDNRYWDALAPEIQQAYAHACVKPVGEAADDQGNFRRLFDIHACQ